MQALATFWRHKPPAAMQLARIARFIGLQDQEPVVLHTKPQDALEELRAAGLPIFEGRPDDPMLDLLDLPVGTMGNRP